MNKRKSKFTSFERKANFRRFIRRLFHPHRRLMIKAGPGFSKPLVGKELELLPGDTFEIVFETQDPKVNKIIKGRYYDHDYNGLYLIIIDEAKDG